MNRNHRQSDPAWQKRSDQWNGLRKRQIPAPSQLAPGWRAWLSENHRHWESAPLGAWRRRRIPPRILLPPRIADDQYQNAHNARAPARPAAHVRRRYPRSWPALQALRAEPGVQSWKGPKSYSQFSGDEDSGSDKALRQAFKHGQTINAAHQRVHQIFRMRHQPANPQIGR